MSHIIFKNTLNLKWKHNGYPTVMIDRETKSTRPNLFTTKKMMYLLQVKDNKHDFAS